MIMTLAWPAAPTPAPDVRVDLLAMILVLTVVAPVALALLIVAFQLFPFAALGYGGVRLWRWLRKPAA